MREVEEVEVEVEVEVEAEKVEEDQVINSLLKIKNNKLNNF